MRLPVSIFLSFSLSLSLSCTKSSGPAGESGRQRAGLGTLNDGARYIAECQAAGVPVPTNILDSTWVNHGFLRNVFETPSLDAELWSWTSTSPRGICLALPRWVPLASPGEAKALGVICQGFDSSKACFWDNLQNQYPPRSAAGNAGYLLDSSLFVGGAALEGNAGQCSDCHAGANAFAVHPNDPAFEDLILDQFREDMMKTASGWYEPIVPKGLANELQEGEAICCDAQYRLM
jgi:hypothetical protein